METNNFKNTATFIHLSSLSQYFIPFGNYIFPLLIWSMNKDKSEFVDHHGKQTLNFQLSLFLYSLILLAIAIPIFITIILNNIPLDAIINDQEVILNNFEFSKNIGLLSFGLTALSLFGILKVSEFFLIIYAAIKTSNGEYYRYPITINFLK